MSLQLAIMRARATKFQPVLKYEPPPMIEPDPIPVPVLRPPAVIPAPAPYVAPKPTHITCDMVRRLVCSHYDVRLIDMMSERRTKGVVFPRQVAQYLCTRMTTLSLPQIGRQFDRDHTTILSTRRKISTMRERDQKFDEELSQLEAQLWAMVQP
jgi:hypothetical protein